MCVLPNEKGISTNKGKKREENASFFPDNESTWKKCNMYD